jgi:hypothetical protein
VGRLWSTGTYKKGSKAYLEPSTALSLSLGSSSSKNARVVSQRSSASWREEHIRSRSAAGEEESSTNEALIRLVGLARATALYSNDSKLGGSCEASWFLMRNLLAEDLHVMWLSVAWLIVIFIKVEGLERLVFLQSLVR